MFCPKCIRYTLKEKCPQCMTMTYDRKPVKFSPEDRYGKYRRMARIEMFAKSESGGE
ncbi:MAG: nucleolar RNA-binding Nop10p family protein [archaeon]